MVMISLILGFLISHFDQLDLCNNIYKISPSSQITTSRVNKRSNHKEEGYQI